MHRWLVSAPKNKMIDHVNRNGIDNRRVNLRFCTKSQNAMNGKRAINNNSGYRGVVYYKTRGNWFAQIWHNNKRHFLGYFDNAKEAATAYNKASKELFGEFAYRNPV